MDWSLIIPIVSSLLGGGVVTLFTAKSVRRKAEFEVWEKQLDEMKEDLTFERNRNRELMQQNIEKEERFVEQTKRLRECQEREYQASQDLVRVTKEKLAVVEELGDLKLNYKDHKCVKLACLYREPENEHTRRAKALVKVNEQKEISDNV